MNASRLLLLSMALSPAILFGQKKEDLLSIQRDIADMTDRVKQLQKAFDDKIAALTALVQQSVDASNKSSAEMAAMQRSLDQKLADQQTKLVAPLATMGAKVDEMSGDFRSVQTNVAELVRHLNTLDDKVREISEAVRTLQAPPPAPPPAAGQTGTVQQQAPDSCAGASLELSYTTALGDYNGKKDDLALQEFAQYVKCFPASANAPNAQYYIGQIYYRNEDWPNAAQAFDMVVEKFPKNPKTADAAYMKACALMKTKDTKTAAGKEFKNFIANYPDSPKVREAHQHLRELGMEGTRAPRKD
jgi:TolA-binding protein